MFSGRPSMPLSVCPCVRDSRGSFMFPRYLQYLLTDFRQTFVTFASWDTDDLVTFLGQKVKVQGHTIATEVHSTTLPSSATFSSYNLFTCWLLPFSDFDFAAFVDVHHINTVC